MIGKWVRRMGERHRSANARAYAMWAMGMAGYIFAAACRSSFSATGIEAARHFGTSSASLSSFVYLQLFVYALMQIPGGVLLDRFGPRTLITAGCLLMSAGQGALALAPSIGIAAFGRAVVGSGDALVFISVIRLLAAWFPLRRLPLMNQLTGQIGNCGQIISIYPLVWLMGASDWTVAFLSCAGVGLLIALCVGLGMRDRPRSNPREGEHRKASPPTMAEVLQGMGRALRVPGTICGFWVHAVTWFSINMLNQLWGFPFLLVVERYSRSQASAYLVAGALLCVGWALLFGRIAGAHPVHGRAVVVYASVIAQMVVWTVVLSTPSGHPTVLMVLLVLALSSGTPTASIAFDYVRDSNRPENLGAATGFANVGGFLFTGIALFAVGAVLDAQGASDPALYTDRAMRLSMMVQYPLWIIGLIGFTCALPGTITGIRQRFQHLST